MTRENFAKLTERMTHEGRVAFTRRAMIGARCIEAAHGRAVTNDEDRETAATDAISDILSALYGPPSGRRDGEEAALLDRALRSYWGDYEDYQ